MKRNKYFKNVFSDKNSQLIIFNKYITIDIFNKPNGQIQIPLKTFKDICKAYNTYIKNE